MLIQVISDNAKSKDAEVWVTDKEGEFELRNWRTAHVF
jgi:hypothetical protein